MVHRSLLVVPLVAALLGAAVPAAETAPGGGDFLAQGTPLTPEQRAQAEQKTAEGLQAMQDSNTTPSRVVDAAILFTEALKLYEAAGDADKARELQANIFWCKKRMNIEDLNAYVTRKGGTAPEAAAVASTVAKMKEVADRTVPLEEAQQYFDRAEAFARQNPDRHFQIAIRYFEVAERFAGSPVSLKAQRLSLDAQQQHMKAIEAQAKQERETLFSKPEAGAKQGAAAIPDASAQKSMLASLKKLYAEDYARSRPAQKQDFAWKLIGEARKTKDDAVARFVMLAEAIRLAQGADDVGAVITAINETARGYAGYDPQAEKTALLGKMRSEAGVAAAKLLTTPKDPAANTIVGRHFCFASREWDAGLQMLAIGADAELKKGAEMELAKPSGAAQQVELADHWYELAGKAKAGQREPIYERARHWYKSALKNGLEGVSKERVSQRLDELWAIGPDPDADWKKLTVTQWDALKAPVFEVRAQVAKNDPKLTLKAGQRLRVVPHPTDTWKAVGFSGEVITTWTGTNRSYFTENGINFMALTVVIDTGAPVKPGVHTGPGRVFLAANDPWTAASPGHIRVKLLLLDD